MILKVVKKHENGETEVKEFELIEKLETALFIQKRFSKPFLQVAKSIGNMSVEELVSFLTCGLRANIMPTDEFKQLVLENMGLADLYDAVSALTMAIQYPGLTEEEIEKKLIAQQEKAKRMSVGLND